MSRFPYWKISDCGKECNETADSNPKIGLCRPFSKVEGMLEVYDVSRQVSWGVKCNEFHKIIYTNKVKEKV